MRIPQSTRRPLPVLRALVLALAVVGASSLTAAAATPSSAPSFVTGYGFCADAEERAFLRLVNNYRAQYGRAPLRLTRTLGAAADHHSIDMANKNYFSHTLAGGITWSQNMSNHGYTYSTARAENIAAGYSTAQQTFNQWKNSAGHNANMLSANFGAIGIGRAYGASSTYKWYWTATFGGYRDAAVTCSA
ncbi:MAG: Transporter [uncultured Thermomicrobiales bacterium]|uniref:Transporter n=1 Tax=uncultured Thermomicrobiales bacterium TaxID=1645740 RepID=A0A6J4VG07_9BACT|nr:MAG: Transporter [uncultured Thermomicrobiales bacterium]